MTEIQATSTFGGEPFAESRGLPAWTYRSKALLELEYKRVILPSWQFACHISEVAAPGDYTTLELLHDSILVMRGQDGVLRAFKNVCRHRGATLLHGRGRCQGPIVCPYHGWTYRQDGELRSILAPRSFPEADRSKLGLEPVELEVFHGLVFVRVIPGGISVAEMWGDLGKHLEPFHLERLRRADRTVADEQVWECNWKAAVDNNLENYHVPIGHPGYARLLDLGPGDVANEHGVYGSITTLKDDSANWTEKRYQRLAPSVDTGRPEETRRTWLFFTMPPNLGIDVYPDSIDVFQMLPRSATTATVRCPTYRLPEEARDLRALRYLNSRINRQVLQEDRELCERVQRGMSAHGYQPGPLSTLEVAIREFHDIIHKVVPEVRLAEEPAAWAGA